MVNKKNLGVMLFLITSITFLIFIVADTVIVLPLSGANFSVREDVTFVYNLSVNNTDTNHNLTQINITFPVAFSMNINYTNGTSSDADLNLTLTNTTVGLVFSWTKNNTYVILTNTSNYFWVNSTVAAPGQYNVTIVSLNTNNTFNTTRIVVVVNDTNKPAVFAANFSSSIIRFGNYSGATNVLNISVIDLGDGLGIGSVFFNVTNITGGSGTRIMATREGSSSSYSVLFDTTSFLNGQYNITAWVNDTTNNLNNSETIMNITINNTKPLIVYAGGMQVNYANISGTSIFVNVTISRFFYKINNITFVLFNSTAQVNSTILFGSTNKTINATTLTWGSLANGFYTFNVTANDPYAYPGNENTTVNYNITLDTAGPIVTATASTTAQTSLVLAFTRADATSGITSDASCSVSRTTAVMSGTTITETGLTCGTAYTYNVSCLDRAGNSGSITQAFTTSACTTSSSGGGSSSSSTWTNSYVITDTQLTSGYTKQLAAKNRIKFKLGTVDHSVGVLSLTTTSATIEVASTPVSATLNIGDEKKFDLNADGYYDVYVKLVSIASSKANIEVKKINEVVSTADEGAGTEEGAGEGEGGTNENLETGETTSSNYKTWIVVIVLVIIIVLVAFGFYKTKKNKRYMMYGF